MSKSTIEELTPFESLKFWNNYREANKDGDFSVGIFGSFTTDAISAHLGASLARFSPEKSVSVTNGAYRQHLRIISNFREEFVSGVDFLVLLWRLEDVVESSLLSFLRGDDDALRLIDEYIEIFTDNLENWSEKDPKILVSVNEVWLPNSVNNSSLMVLSRFSFLQNRIYERFTQTTLGKSNVAFISWSQFTFSEHSFSFLDKRNQALYSDPFSSKGSLTIGNNVAKLIYASSLAINKKVLVLDCDNTIWGGIVGEVGFQGVEIGSDGDGYYFCLFQQEIKQLKNNGTLLALSSKNNLEDVREVFLRNDKMILKWEDFIFHEVNWKPKSQSIEKISSELNILPDDFIFVDDSDFEIEEVRSAIAGISTIRIPNERFEIPGILAQSGYFFSEETSREDRDRTKYIEAEKVRNSVKAQLLSPDDFLNSLELQIEVSQIDYATLSRATQLINKTNQFNLTTKRRTEPELQKFLAEPGVYGFVTSAKDKFGDYGYIGLCILVQESHRLVIDTFLMSCRALSREIEFAFLDSVLKSMIGYPVQVEAYFIPTMKNGPAEPFLQDYGFVKDPEVPHKFILNEPPAECKGMHIKRIVKSDE